MNWFYPETREKEKGQPQGVCGVCHELVWGGGSERNEVLGGGSKKYEYVVMRVREWVRDRYIIFQIHPCTLPKLKHVYVKCIHNVMYENVQEE